ncbi:MAG: hypothetical protein V4687_02185 [Bacteroidota bacterium]
MNLNTILCRFTALLLLLGGFSVAESKAQVLPGQEINNILKRIYDRPIPAEFVLDAYRYEGHGKKIVIYGTNHSIRNSADPLFSGMEDEFAKLAPTVVFTEAISSYLHTTRDQNIQGGGDAAFPRFLAHKSGIDAYIWDLDWSEAYNFVHKEFSREDLYLFFYCLKLNRAQVATDLQLDALIKDKSRELSFMGYPVSAKEWDPEYFKSIFKRHFGLTYNSKFSSKDWDLVDSFFDTGVFAKIKSKLFQFRDKRLLMAIGAFAKTNDRIFVQAGAMHKEVMKQVLPLYMESNAKQQPEKQVRQITSLAKDSIRTTYHRKFKVGKKEILLWASDSKEPSQTDELTRDLLAFKPSAILIEDFPEHFQMFEDNLNYAGEPGVLRFLGAKNDLPVFNWASQVTQNLHLLSKKYKREDVCSVVTFHYLQKYEQVYKNFADYNSFWNAFSSRLLCSNTLFTYYEASIGRFSEYAVGYGIIAQTESGNVPINFDKLRATLSLPGLKAINDELELLKANELLNSVSKYLRTNDRIFVHAPYSYIKALENSIPAIN